jgi:protocatechuate 3,4-dioxygenase beta subunit
MGLSNVLALLFLTQAAGGGAATVPVTGRVVDAEGQAVAGAEVVLAEGTRPIRNTVRGRLSTPAVLAAPAILARGATDGQGRFRVEMPRRSADPEYRVRPLVLWAWTQGRAPALRTIPDEWPEDGEEVTLTLSSPPRLPVRVVDPDGRPVSGAEVMPGQVRGRRPPLVLAERLAATTDKEGRATMEAAAAESLDQVRVVAASFGTQVVRTPRPDADGVRTIALAPAGRVEGRLTAGDPRAVAGVAVRLHSSVDDVDAEVGAGGVAEVVSDDDGRFNVPALAAGTLAVSFRPHGELPYRGDYLNHRPVEPGQTTRLEIPLQRAVLVKGAIREAGTGAPVAGARVSIDRDITAPFVTTDDQGNYAAYLMPGVVPNDPILNPPAGYYVSDSFTRPDIPTGVREFQASVRKLRRNPEAVQGLVVDRQGHPVPGATITATWAVGQYPDGPTRELQAQGVSDRKGLFRVEGVPAKVSLRLAARYRERATDQVEPVKPEDGPFTLTLDDIHLISLNGRVVDAKGRPVSWATVSLESDRRTGVRPGGMGYEHEVVLLDEDEGETVRTNADGQFTTGRVMAPGRIVRARVEAPGCWQTRSGWIESGTTTTFPDIVVMPNEPTRVVEGRVVDTAGRPLPGLTVFQSGDGPLRTRTVTDAAGRFRLPGVFRAEAIVFVEGEGVPLQGHVIGAAERPVELVAHRAGEPGGRPLRVLPPPASAAEMRALALRLVVPDLANRPLERLFEEDRLLAQIVLLADLTRDPVTFKGLSDLERDSIRCDRALSSFPHEPRGADVLAEQIQRPATRSKYFRLSSDRLPPADRDQKLARLERALQNARDEKDETLRMAEIGMIGSRLLDLGERERGKEVLREGRKLAQPPASDVRPEYAPYLARLDGPAALPVIRSRLSPPFRGRSKSSQSMLLLSLAEIDPDEAERVLHGLPAGLPSDYLTAKAAGRMSLLNRVRARRLAESINEPSVRGIALAWMVRNLRPTDPKAATALLDEATIALAGLDREGRGRGGSPRGIQILLPAAEALGPEALRRVFWTAAAMRPAWPPGGDPNKLYEGRAADLAFVLARYDRDLARVMVAPLLRQPAAIHNTDSSGRSLWWSVRAAAAIEPAWAVEFVEAMPDDSPLVKERPKGNIRRSLAFLLARGFESDWIREFEDDDRDQPVP